MSAVISAAFLWVGASGCSKSATSPPVATQVEFTSQPPSTVVAATTIPPIQVDVRDAGGSLVATGTSTVSMTLSSPDAPLRGATMQATVNGVASFTDLSVTKTGAYALVATSGTLTSATSNGFNITPSTTSQLVFTGQPTTTVEGRPISPPIVVTAQDAFGNATPSFFGNVTIALGANPLSATLFGTTIVTAINGVATFPLLMIATGSTANQGTVAGTGYALTASSAALAPTTSASFSIGTTGVYYWAPVPLMPGYIEACYFLSGAACGSIIASPKVAVIYWSGGVIYTGGPAPGTKGAGAQDGSLIGFFLRNVGGSAYYAATATYYEVPNASLPNGVTSVENNATYTQYWADSVGPADTAPTDSAIQAEVEHALTSGALAYDSNTMYAVFSGPGVNLGGGFTEDSGGYCGEHSYFVDALGRNVKYAILPHDYDLHNGHPYTCDVLDIYGSPNAPDSAADAEVNVLAHEFAETITDEYLDAWFDNSGNEMADLCNFTFSSFTPLGGKNFLVQRLWVNEETVQGSPVGCVQSSGSGAARPTEVAAAAHPETATRLHTAREGGRHTMLQRRR